VGAAEKRGKFGRKRPIFGGERAGASITAADLINKTASFLHRISRFLRLFFTNTSPLYVRVPFKAIGAADKCGKAVVRGPSWLDADCHAQ